MPNGFFAAYSPLQYAIWGIAAALVVILLIVVIALAIHLKIRRAQNEIRKEGFCGGAQSTAERGAITIQTEPETAFMTQGLSDYGIDSTRLQAILSMSLPRLFDFVRDGADHLPERFMTDVITRRALLESGFACRSDITDIKVPVDLTTNFTRGQIERYLATRGRQAKRQANPDAEQHGASTAAAQNETGAFALLREPNTDTLCLTVKCGATYAGRLSQLYSGFGKSTRDNPLWLTVTSRNQNAGTTDEPATTTETPACSLELIKLLIDISHALSTAGY